MSAKQQGDVRMVAVSSIPRDATVVKRQPRGYILAEGEATGHAHVITEPAELYVHGDILYLRTTQAVTVTHEEHHPVTLEPGIWRIRRVREKDMFEGFVRRIQD